MPSPSTKNYHLLQYADDTALIELLHGDEPSPFQQASESLINWCANHNLLIDVRKTTERFFSNRRFSPACYDLILNDVHVVRVQNFKCLHTILDSKLNFKMNSDAAEKARRRISIMKSLSSLKMTEPIRVKCYVTFIECCFLHHLSTIHGHLTKASKKNIDSIIRLARCVRIGEGCER